MTDAPDLPQHEYTIYGRQVATYSEDYGFIVAGHDRRSWAAMNRMIRDGYGPLRVDASKVRPRWAHLWETCGCTAEQHALHGVCPPDDADEDDARYRDCESACVEQRAGLPPCGDTYTWMIEDGKEGDPGVVPILELTW